MEIEILHKNRGGGFRREGAFRREYTVCFQALKYWDLICGNLTFLNDIPLINCYRISLEYFSKKEYWWEMERIGRVLWYFQVCLLPAHLMQAGIRPDVCKAYYRQCNSRCHTFHKQSLLHQVKMLGYICV
mgnify:CR=1 FL=1